MKWSDSAAIRKQLMRRWRSGALCRAAIAPTECFPMRLPLKQPSARVMLDQFDAMRSWVAELRRLANSHALQLAWREVHHRSLGRNELPVALLLDSPEEAATLIGKTSALKRFRQLHAMAADAMPADMENALQAWLLKRPLKALELYADWPHLLIMCRWMQAHPKPAVYLRQVDASGIDSKFIERHRGVLGELFDTILPVSAMDEASTGVNGFARRYGFLDKPVMLRVRPLDPAIRLLHSDGDQDISLTAGDFARLKPAVHRVFITENEVNYLAFPAVPQSLMIFGAGYGFDALIEASWLARVDLLYWGDIDTHGFAILDQLRAHFPKVRSLLMDRKTLMAHQRLWGDEPKPERRDLSHLTADEAVLYDDLRCDRLGEHVRLEQERISFAHVKKHIPGTDGRG